MKSLLILSLIFVFPFSSYADQDNDQRLLNEIDQTQIKLERDIESLDSNLKILEDRVTRFNKDIIQINTIRDGVDEKHKEIASVEAKYQSIFEKISELKSQNVRLNERVNTLEKDVIRIQGEIGSSEQLIAWITVIVSIIIVLIGLFFSKLFLNLYTNYHVVCSHLPKEVLDKAEGLVSKE
ncbi:hypothetical protein [Vibrio owensii]|uniref:hypothetical protein n=1 Tax=Vibrio harveyi group TaxID=717610 RepID=UPI00148C3D9F|nr:hypothetical protein [Vibrio owensii]MDA0384076.1 hypothetical protein [Vibrio owensii]NOI70208.1 hypothetical protein [Vibrio owensii]